LNATSSTTTQSSCTAIVWNTQNISATGTYTSSFTNAAGCDSIATLNFTKLNATSSATTQSSCTAIVWNTLNISATGTYTASFTNAVGCDSIATLYFTKLNATSSTTNIASCTPYIWTNGTTYSVTTTATQTFVNAAGCDSIATLNFTRKQATSSTTNIVACDSFLWTNGITYTASGNYTMNMVNAAGCDSFVTLNLTIHHSSSSAGIIYGTTSAILPWGTIVTVGGIYSNTYTNAIGCDSIVTITVSLGNVLKITPKIMLAGCFDPATGLMYDSLRVLNLIPLQEPYSSAPYNAIYTHINGGGGETTSASVFTVTGPNAIVDWVFVQLRNKLDSNIVLATRSALIQRDGDIVDVDGVSPLIFANNNVDNYFISIKHRNHLGIMTKTPIPISFVNTSLNLTTAAIPLFTKPGKAGNPAPLTGATRIINGVRCLYAGNCNISL
jgi:hypothetical protein